MDKFSNQNRQFWDDITPVHIRSEFYDVKGFVEGRNTLTSIERGELGDVSGKTLLHLQCHFGMDTLSWARLGAQVTGVDFSEEAIEKARSLSAETGLAAEFICSDIYELPRVLDRQFDIVFTSRGVLAWLPDLAKWGHIISHFLKKGGVFYIFESHPLMNTLEYDKNTDKLDFRYDYFHCPDPTIWPPDFDYADRSVKREHSTCEWTHPLSEIINTLIDNGLKIEFLHEFPVLFFQANPLLARDKDGWWRLKGDKLPLSFSIRATRL